VISQACNEFPPGLEVTDEMLERPLKYTYIEHAERNAIYRSSLYGSAARPYLMVAPWSACAECARAIVCSGISVLVRHKQASDRSPERWVESIAIADDILRQGKVRIIDVDDPDIGGVSILHNGELWEP
jgi:dCMP deaminase